MHYLGGMENTPNPWAAATALIGQTLANQARAQGVSVRQLAQRSGVAMRTVAGLLGPNPPANVTLETLIKLADVLGYRVLLELVPKTEPRRYGAHQGPPPPQKN